MTDDGRYGDEPTHSADTVVEPRDLRRAEETETDGTQISIGLQTIDTAVITFLAQKIRPVVIQNDVAVTVPVVYGDPERWKSVQKDGVYRDAVGKIQLPVIMVRRSGMARNQLNNASNKHLQRSFRAGWDSRTPYDRFAVENGVRPQNKYYTISSIPDYYTLTYKGIIWTEYMEHMNSIVENISFESDEFWGVPGQYRFRAYIKRFDTSTQLPATADRVVKTQFELAVFGYLLPKTALDRNGNRMPLTRVSYPTKKIVTFTETEG